MKDRLSLILAGLVIILLSITLAQRQTATAQANDQATKPSPASAIFTVNANYNFVEYRAGSGEVSYLCRIDGIKGDWIHCASDNDNNFGWINASHIYTAYLVK